MDVSDISASWLGRRIDHAVLAPQASRAELIEAVETAERHNVACLCVRPCDVSEAKKLLSSLGGGAAVGTVIGFPHGSSTSQIKVAEAEQAIADGAGELDMVLNIARLKEGRLDYVQEEIAAIVSAAGEGIVKVILECCYLDREHMAQACEAAQAGGAQYVKTSTGFGEYGARAEDVQFLRQQVGEKMGVKAAGGIGTLADALEMIAAGADRIGTSNTERILAELEGEGRR